MYLSIKKAAIFTGIPEHILRKMRKMDELPGFSSGSRFYVNTDKLTEKMAQNVIKLPSEVR